MNIKEAKEQIKNTVKAYLTKDEYGDYILPVEKQRPIFLMGAPGIGKTAIMEQVAGELQVGLLSYSMTHHTRQSALGLPFISHKIYGNEEFDISEYTMSEIIASVYEMMEKTGIKNGILFLDEINCVSETLYPIMLQFLQYKVFGRHRVPEGWVVVTAGNPPEFNHSVREFDVVTWDRLKRIDVEPDFEVWKEYATGKGVHPAILTYLEAKNDCFYRIKQTVEGKRFVTARGWEDLSQIMRLYDRTGIEIDDKLMLQYLQEEEIAKDFSIYYELFKKYKSEYNILNILVGKVSEEVKEKATNSGFDERIAMIGMFLDRIREKAEEVNLNRNVLKAYKKEVEDLESLEEWEGIGKIQKIVEERQEFLKKAKESGSLSKEEMIKHKRILSVFEEKLLGRKEKNKEKMMKTLRTDYEARIQELKKDVNSLKEKLDNMFSFLKDAFGEGKEILIAVTELTKTKNTVLFISTFGCDSYFKYSKEFMLKEKNHEIDEALKNLGLL